MKFKSLITGILMIFSFTEQTLKSHFILPHPTPDLEG